MKLVRVLSLVLLVSLILTAGCSTTGHRGQAKASSNSVRNQAGLLRYAYDLSKGASRLSLSLTLHATEGTFLYTLVDPAGTPAWQGRVDTGQSLNETHPLKPVPGRWVLNLEMANATGSYDVVWKSE
jgi:hypothetical protein